METLMWAAAWVVGSWAAALLMGRRIRRLVQSDGDDYYGPGVDAENRSFIRWCIVLAPLVLPTALLLVAWVCGEFCARGGRLVWVKRFFEAKSFWERLGV